VTSCDKVSERPTEPTQQELTSAQPLPSLINRAVQIDFDSLVAGERIYDSNDTEYTLKQKVNWYWTTNTSLRIDNENIKNFHRQ
jgi:hypothetical protein